MIQSDWLDYATKTKHPRRIDPAYCLNITEARVYELAIQMLDRGSICIDDYCDEQGLYGEARIEVRDKVWTIFRMLEDYFQDDRPHDQP